MSADPASTEPRITGQPNTGQPSTGLPGIELRIPEAVWLAILDLLGTHRPGVERVAYLDGFRIDEAGYPDVALDAQVFVATTVVVSEAVLRPRNYVVPAEAVSAAGRHLRVGRMTRVSQIHTHGNDWVEHSPTDDDRAYSQRPGAVSIVVPFHGATRPELEDCGVHVRTATAWQRVRPDSVIKIIPSVLDHRSTTWEPARNSTHSGATCSRFREWIKTAWMRLVHSGWSST